MIARWDIIQGSLDWFEARYGKIGGTTSKQLMIDSGALLEELISTRLEPFEAPKDGYASEEMQRGAELEPMARVALSEYTGLGFLECGWLQSESHTMLGISPDGITEDLRFECEIKCPSRKKHTANLLCGEIPLEYLPQCVHSFTVNPTLERKYFLSFRPESKYPMYVKSITRDSIVNLGTNSRPVLKTVSDWVEVSKKKHDALEVSILAHLSILDF